MGSTTFTVIPSFPHLSSSAILSLALHQSPPLKEKKPCSTLNLQRPIFIFIIQREQDKEMGLSLPFSLPTQRLFGHQALVACESTQPHTPLCPANMPGAVTPVSLPSSCFFHTISFPSLLSKSKSKIAEAGNCYGIGKLLRHCG